MAQYYAISATQQVEYYTSQGERRIGMNWSIMAGPCASRDEARKKGLEAIGPQLNQYGQDHGYGYGLVDTLKRNLTIVPKSKLREHRIFETSENWGGARKGAGRPRKYIKVPV